jgi:phenylacetate-CoA ligase
MLAETFGPPTVAAALAGLHQALQPAVLGRAVEQELGRADLLDRWRTDFTGAGLVRAYPLGVVAEVLAGNVFLGGVIALAQALLTRNAVLLKLSSADSGFTELFAATLMDADDGMLADAIAVCVWSSKEESLNQVVRDEADAVVVWGGQAAIDAYPAERCRGRVIHHGPRLGVGFVLEGVDLEAALSALAWDVALWEQRACSSPRLLFVEDRAGDGKYPAQVAAGLSAALTGVRAALPARPLTLDDKAEVLALRELADWQDGARCFAAPQSMDHTVLLGDRAPDSVPLGHRTVRVVPFTDLGHIQTILAPYRAGLQTAVLAAPRSRWPDAVDELARAGISQVAAAGAAAAARFLGLPHEGEFALRRLVRLVGIDLGMPPLCQPDRPAPDVVETLTGGQ